jgi:hypothetical protein
MEKAPQKTERVEHLKEMPKDWRILREKILNNFESKTDGLDIERVKDFMKERNLPIKDFILFDMEDVPKLQEIFGENDIRVITGVSGIYLSMLDMIFMRRDREMERVNGSVYGEGNLVHEMNHAANVYNTYSKKGEVVTRPRSGFVVLNTHFRAYNGKKVEKKEKQSPWGYFLEEGFADLQRGDYIEKNISAVIKEKRNRLSAMANEYETQSGSVYQESKKYLAFMKDGETIGAPFTSIAATGIEMLCEKIPNLGQVLIEARSDIEKLREIPRLINAIKPGLYLEIQKCGYSQDEFIRVQNIIKEAIQNSK